MNTSDLKSSDFHTLKIELNNIHNFYKVTCPEGDYITDYTDDMDPKDYYGCKEMYAPTVLSEDKIRETYHCVTEGEHLEYEKVKEEAFKKEEEDSLKKMMRNPSIDENKDE